MRIRELCFQISKNRKGSSMTSTAPWHPAVGGAGYLVNYALRRRSAC